MKLSLSLFVSSRMIRTLFELALGLTEWAEKWRWVEDVVLVVSVVVYLMERHEVY